MPVLPDRSGRALPDGADVVVDRWRLCRDQCGPRAGRRAASRSRSWRRRPSASGPRRGTVGSSTPAQVERPGADRAPRRDDRPGALPGDARRLPDGQAPIADEAIECDFRESGHLELAYAPAHVAVLEHAAGQPRVRRASRADLVERGHARGDRLRRVLRGAGRWRGAGCSTRRRTSRASPRPPTGPARTCTRASGRSRDPAHRRDGRFVVETERGRDPSPATSSWPRTATRTGSPPALRRRVIPIGSYIIASEPLPEDLAHGSVAERPIVLRYEELPVLLARLGGPPDDLRRTSELHAHLDGPHRADPPPRPARGPPAARRLPHRRTRGAATSASPSTGCPMSAGPGTA